MVEMTAGALVALTQPAFRGGSVTGNADTPLAHPYFPACSSKLPLLPIYFFSFARAFYKLRRSFYKLRRSFYKPRRSFYKLRRSL